MSKRTHRTTRDRLIDLLEEAIKLVKVRCVGPEEDVLQTARREFQEAADMKNQAAALLKTAREAELQDEAPLTSNGFAEPLPEVLPQVPATSQVSLAQVSRPNFSITRKKLPSCPGGPKAFNEFLKSKRAEVEANLGPNAKYADVRAEISKRWKETCNKNTKKKSKTKTLATPGRVNAPATLLEAVPAVAAVEPAPAVEPTPAVEPAVEPESEAAVEAAVEPESEATVEPAPAVEEALGYEDEGLDDTLGMRRIVIEGRPLYMTNANKGLFDRSDDELGSFVGYLRNGKIVEQDAPNDV